MNVNVDQSTRIRVLLGGKGSIGKKSLFMEVFHYEYGMHRLNNMGLMEKHHASLLD